MPEPCAKEHSRGAQESGTATSSRRTYLSLRQVGEKFGVKERTAHKLISEPWMPPPVALGSRLYRWIEEEIDAAVAARAPRRLEREAEPARLARAREPRGQALTA